MYDSHDLAVLIRSAPPMIFCTTTDESRILSLLTESAITLGKDSWSWSCVDGLQRTSFDSTPQMSLNEAVKVLQHIRKLTVPGIFALLDFHPYLDDPKVIRLLKEIALQHNEYEHTLVFISGEIQIPAELQAFSIEYALAVPSRERITQIIKEELDAYLSTQAGGRVTADSDSVQLLIRSLLGLPEVDIRRLAKAAICDDEAVTASDVKRVMEAKKSLLERDGVLEFEYDTATFREVAGLSKMKEWLRRRHAVLDMIESKQSSLAPPKGILLLGVQGCGKSLAAKAVAGSWGLPLLRLDMGAVFNKFMGETERRMRDALSNAQTLAPCVLWIDELEKGIASTDFDGGTAQRVLGTLLTWMAEKKEFVFLVATANSIEGLPPELLRKGRFDEVFFVDLPGPEVRKELFEIHLRKRQIPDTNVSPGPLLEASEGFSGAEIEQAIVSALYATAGSAAAVTTEVLLKELGQTRPLSKLLGEQVSRLQAWAQDRCVFAD